MNDTPIEVVEKQPTITEQLPTPGIESELDLNFLEGQINGLEYLENYCPTEMAPGALTGLLREMIGTPSCGFEFIEYAVAGSIFVILIALVANVFVGFSKLLGAR